MPEITLIKTISGLMPADTPTDEWYKKLKSGELAHGTFSKMRNPAFHRKYMALLNIGFENWNPCEIDSKYGIPEKNFDRFRKDVAILAGFYEVVIRLDGSTRIEAKSISFASMDDLEFEKLYSATIDVLLKKVYGEGMSREEIDNIVESYLRFA